MQKHNLLRAPLLALLALVPVAAFATTAAAVGGEFTLTPDQLAWQDGKTTQALPVHADPAYQVVTRRVRIAPSTDLPPHGHERGYRVVTVVSGTLLLGFGERFDAAALKTLPPGSVFSEQAGHKHFARTLAEPVVLQLTEVQTAAPATQEQRQ